MSMLDYLDRVSKRIERLHNQNVIPEVIEYLGTCHSTSIGDNRDDNHRGVLTKDPMYVSFFHLTEYGLLNHLSKVQWKSVLRYYAQWINAVMIRFDSRKGSHSGIKGNVTRGSVVRQYHCKFMHRLQYCGTKNGIVAFWDYSETKRTLMYVTKDGTVGSHSTQELDDPRPY